MFLSSIKYLELFLSYSASKGSNLNIPSADIIKLSALFKAFFIEILEFNNLSYIRDDLSLDSIVKSLIFLLSNPFAVFENLSLISLNSFILSSIILKSSLDIFSRDVFGRVKI